MLFGWGALRILGMCFIAAVPNLFAPGTNFVEDNFSTDCVWGGGGFRMIQVHYFIVHFISIIIITSAPHFSLSSIRSWRLEHLLYSMFWDLSHQWLLWHCQQALKAPFKVLLFSWWGNLMSPKGQETWREDKPLFSDGHRLQWPLLMDRAWVGSAAVSQLTKRQPIVSFVFRVLHKTPE